MKIIEYYHSETDTDQRNTKPKVFKGDYDTWDDAYKGLNKFLDKKGYLDIVSQYEETA